MTPAQEHALEMLNFEFQMSQFDKNKHLKKNEAQYLMPPWANGDIWVVRETEEGWWVEEIDYKHDPEKQIRMLIEDPTVALVFASSPRFPGNGGWEDPNG